jgi:hypothetical protein
VSDVKRFEFAFSPAHRRAGLPFGITPSNAWVDVDGEGLHAHFGLWGLSTSLANISDVYVTGPYAFWKTAGPARLALTDRGLTFATNGDRGVLMSFRSPVQGQGPMRMLRHTELTVTVADTEGLADLLRNRTG